MEILFYLHGEAHPTKHNPADTRHQPNVALMVAQRLRRWLSINATFGIVSIGKYLVQCWFNVDPPSSTLVQHFTNAIQMFLFTSWVRTIL